MFACLRDQRSTENLTLQNISNTIQLLFGIAKQNESPRYSFIQDTLQVLGAILWGIDFRLQEVEHELALISNKDARSIRPLIAIELARYPQYLVEKAEAERNANGLNQQAQETQVPGTKKRARSADNDDDMVGKEEPQSKQPHQIAQPKRSRFHSAISNSQAVSNNGIVAPKGNVFSDVHAIAPPPQHQQLFNAANVNAATVSLPPAGDDEMDVDMDGGMEMDL